jgi:hypothetical protein
MGLDEVASAWRAELVTRLPSVLALCRALAGAGLALSAGVAKELWDLSGHGDPSWKDLAWDGMGTGVGVGLALGVDLLLFRQRERALPSQAALLIRF